MSVPPPNGWGYRNGSSGPLKCVYIRPFPPPRDDIEEEVEEPGWKGRNDLDGWHPYRPNDEIWLVFAVGTALYRTWWDDNLQKHSESVSWDDFPGFYDYRWPLV